MSPLHTFYGFWDPWLDPMKVTFDGENRLILINEGETEIDVQKDLYSCWKRWTNQIDNMKFPQALKVIGGDPINATNIITPYFFLTNGWRIRPYEGDHRLTLNGIILTDDNQDPLVPTLQAWNISVTRIVPVKSESVLIGSTAPTASENATAVWGSSPTAFPLSGTDKADIAHRVWNQPTDTIYDPGSFGEFFKMWFANKLLTVSKFLALK